jgi:hypothetical protein
MENEFDKQMDALLRNAGGGSFGAAPGSHLDADELAAFAENALPERSRNVLMRHLADCGGCRKGLAVLVRMGPTVTSAAEYGPALPATTGVETPWYRRLFSFPQLAYGLGGIVLIFAGLLGYSVFRTANEGASSISQIEDQQPAASGPNFDPGAGFANTNAASVPAANATNTAANSASNTVANRPVALSNTAAAAATPATDGPTVDTSAAPVGIGQAAPAPPPPAAAPKEAQPAEREADAMISKDEAKRDAKLSQVEKQRAEDKVLAEAPAAVGPMKAKRSAPRNERYEERAATGAGRDRAAIRDDNTARNVGGKYFVQRQNVWYDSAYSSQPSISVRRGTAEYRALPAGLRSIADRFTGVVVIVWGAKAYRIQ